jgi:hypothetical protein
MRWGLIPFWGKDTEAGYKMINARAETIAEKPAFREPLLSRRCLIPADGFYEWTKRGKGKSPFCFTLADDSVFAFAGIWDRWRNPERELVETRHGRFLGLHQGLRRASFGCSSPLTSVKTLVGQVFSDPPTLFLVRKLRNYLKGFGF